MSDNNKANFRLRITDAVGNISFIVRKGTNHQYMNGSMVSLSLTYLADRLAAELSFILEDASNGETAAAAIIDLLKQRNIPPKIEVML